MRRPGRADDDVRAALQALELRGVALAAVDRQHVEAGQLRGVLLERLGHLDRELARGRRAPAPAARAASRSMRERIGSAKAAVLPVPVWAWPSRSAPASMTGMVSAWMGEGVS